MSGWRERGSEGGATCPSVAEEHTHTCRLPAPPGAAGKNSSRAKALTAGAIISAGKRKRGLC